MKNNLTNCEVTKCRQKKSDISVNNELLTQLNVLVKLFIKWVTVSLTSKILLVKIENKIVLNRFEVA